MKLTQNDLPNCGTNKIISNKQTENGHTPPQFRLQSTKFLMFPYKIDFHT